jgi:hypothetical protein
MAASFNFTVKMADTTGASVTQNVDVAMAAAAAPPSTPPPPTPPPPNGIDPIVPSNSVAYPLQNRPFVINFSGRTARLVVYERITHRVVADITQDSSSESGSISWNPQDLPSGSYPALLETPGGSKRFMLVVVK